MTPANIIGINIGGTTTSIVRGNRGGHIDDRVAFPTREHQSADGMTAALVGAVQELRARSNERVETIGLAVGGPLDVAAGVLLRPPHLWWYDGYPLRERLAQALGMAVIMHHDAAACALAEYRWGRMAGASRLAYLTCGTGFGTGLIFDGRAYYGTGGLSPEIGHVRYAADGPDLFGKPGAYEGYGSARALGGIARWRFPQRFADTTPEDVARLAAAGDVDALAVVALNAEAVGAACALMIDLLGLDAIVLGSTATYLGAPWVAAVEATVRREALPQNLARCRIMGVSMPELQDLSGLAAALD